MPERTCPCGSGKPRHANHDARGIFLTFTCETCHQRTIDAIHDAIGRLIGVRNPVIDDILTRVGVMVTKIEPVGYLVTFHERDDSDGGSARAAYFTAEQLRDGTLPSWSMMLQ